MELMFEVCRTIAQENELACVAFPEPGSQHLMSNRTLIYRYLRKRCISQAGMSGARIEIMESAAPRDEKCHFTAVLGL